MLAALLCQDHILQKVLFPSELHIVHEFRKESIPVCSDRYYLELILVFTIDLIVVIRSTLTTQANIKYKISHI